MTAYVTDDNSILRLNILFELFGLATGSSRNNYERGVRQGCSLSHILYLLAI